MIVCNFHMQRILQTSTISILLIVICISLPYAQQDSQLLKESTLDDNNLVSDSELMEKILPSLLALDSTAKSDMISSTQSDTLIIDRLITLGNAYVNQGEVDSLELVLRILSNYNEESGLNKSRLRRLYILNSRFYSIKADLVNELKVLLKAKQITDDAADQFLINQDIAIIYYRLLDFKSCLAIYESNLDLIKEQNDPLDLLFTYYGIADCNIELGNEEYAKRVCFNALDVSEQSGYSNSLGYIYALLGTIYINETKIDSAQYYLDKGVAISKKQNDIKELYDNYTVMVKLELLKGDKAQAQHYAEIAVENAIFHDPELYNDLAHIYSSQNDYRRATDVLNKNVEHYKNTSDKKFLYNIVSSLLKDKYDQEKAIQLAASEQQFQKTKIRIIIIAAILLLLGTLFIIYNQIINKRKIKKINEDLIDRNKNLEQFAFICSHDLKEPITNIVSFSNLLQQDLKKENLKLDYGEYFDIIDNGTKNLVKIVDSLKVYTDLNQEMVLTKAKVLLNPLINDILSSTEQFANDKSVTLTLTTDIINQEIFTSEYGIRLILVNIVENAIKHNLSQNKQISIKTSRVKNDVLITVEDNGLGIPEAYIDHIFLPFKTLKNKSLTNSSGLGLAICTRIIGILGGKIWVESEVGKGSKFHILIEQ